jgi:mRNA-degrading endonuclease RelE of RelBE toxin-antitoxin system
MELIYEKGAIKSLKRIQPKVAQAIQTALEKIAANPFGAHLNAKPMEGTKAGFRLRHGDWRIIYAVNQDKQIVTVVDVKPRGRAHPMTSDTVTLPRSEYEALIERLEDLEDAARLRAFEAREDKADGLPAALVRRMLAGEHPVRIWREHRGLSMQDLAGKAEVAQSYISEIETGKKPGSLVSMKALATALGVTVDDLIP